MKTQNIKSRCYRTGKYTVCSHVRASFSPEILQAMAVLGLTLDTFHTTATTISLDRDCRKLGESELNHRHIPHCRQQK